MIDYIWILPASLAVLVLVYLWCLMGRRGHKDMAKFRGWNYAHRGLHDGEKPENSMAAFRAALEHGYGIELDVHLLKDGGLAVMHDSSLQRTAGADVILEDLTTQELDPYHLGETGECIPLLQQVLELYDGKAPLIVELKTYRNNYAELCQAACAMMDRYDGLYCMESFDPRAVHWLRKNRPDIVRGQLSENWLKTKVPYPWILKLAMACHIGNVYGRPDFIAYKFEDRKTFGTDICRKVLGIPGVSWTLKTREQYDQAVKEGWIPIFEGFTVE